MKETKIMEYAEERLDMTQPNGVIVIKTDVGLLKIVDGHLYGYIKNRLITVDGRSVQMMRTQHYLPSAGLNEFDPITGTWRF